MISGAANLKLHFSSVSSELDDYVGSRLALRYDCNLLDGIPKIDGFYSLYLRAERETRFSLYISTFKKQSLRASLHQRFRKADQLM